MQKIQWTSGGQITKEKPLLMVNILLGFILNPWLQHGKI